jgi:hypothetical protein
MKLPSGDLMFYAALLLGGAVYVAVGVPTTAAEYRAVAVAFAACLAVGAVLLLVRFRWSPEVYATLFVFVLGWGVVRASADGFTLNRLGMAVGAAAALSAYPSLRRDVRGVAVTPASTDATSPR